MTVEDRILKIKEHFDNISLEHLEQALIRAGMGEIKPTSVDADEESE